MLTEPQNSRLHQRLVCCKISDFLFSPRLESDKGIRASDNGLTQAEAIQSAQGVSPFVLSGKKTGQLKSKLPERLLQHKLCVSN